MTNITDSLTESPPGDDMRFFLEQTRNICMVYTAAEVICHGVDWPLPRKGSNLSLVNFHPEYPNGLTPGWQQFSSHSTYCLWQVDIPACRRDGGSWHHQFIFFGQTSGSVILDFLGVHSFVRLCISDTTFVWDRETIFLRETQKVECSSERPSLLRASWRDASRKSSTWYILNDIGIMLLKSPAVW